MRHENRVRRSATAAAVLTLALAATAWSQVTVDGDLSDWGLSGFLGEADLVFHGQVIDIAYARADATEMEPLGMPHMFITYRVDEVLHGSYSGRELTLRFLGGYDDEDHSYLGSNLTPRFDIGDEDILFVDDQARAACPLVDNHKGRLRVIEGRVYDDNGHSVRRGERGQLSIGPRYFLREVVETEVMGEILLGNYDPEALQGPSDAAHAEDVLELIRDAARDVAPPRVAVESADPRIPFAVLDLVPTTMKDLSSDEERQ